MAASANLCVMIHRVPGIASSDSDLDLGVKDWRLSIDWARELNALEEFPK